MIKLTNLLVRTGLRSFQGALSSSRSYCAVKDGGNELNQSLKIN